MERTSELTRYTGFLEDLCLSRRLCVQWSHVQSQERNSDVKNLRGCHNGSLDWLLGDGFLVGVTGVIGRVRIGAPGTMRAVAIVLSPGGVGTVATRPVPTRCVSSVAGRFCCSRGRFRGRPADDYRVLALVRNILKE